MTKEELIAKLNEEIGNGDQEAAHVRADDLLIEYINDPDIKEAYAAVPKWYA